ncbi:MAG: hypothetical protein J3Q66DRAFT_340730 [Benniella sp.]|nr:MAG: hypothetical protein J3Q66DRAFT_340730 [Benniella sp.]
MSAAYADAEAVFAAPLPTKKRTLPPTIDRGARPKASSTETAPVYSQLQETQLLEVVEVIDNDSGAEVDHDARSQRQPAVKPRRKPVKGSDLKNGDVYFNLSSLAEQHASTTAGGARHVGSSLRPDKGKGRASDRPSKSESMPTNTRKRHHAAVRNYHSDSSFKPSQDRDEDGNASSEYSGTDSSQYPASTVFSDSESTLMQLGESSADVSVGSSDAGRRVRALTRWRTLITTNVSACPGIQ